MPQKAYSTKWLPTSRKEALSLLRSVNDDAERLTEGQRQQIGRLYRVHDDRTIEELVKAGVIRS